MKIYDTIKTVGKNIVNEFGVTKSVAVIATGLASGFAGVAATSIVIPNKPILEIAKETINTIEEVSENEEI